MEESRYIHMSHNVRVLIYQLVTPARYRRAMLIRRERIIEAKYV
ncbi:MAG: hypothetical protein O7C59_09150 [Rickettsia endosymbiont of Ixodes persulcatus]|nr:hypothetical protein [Rickettsia endosymbiont of Ixodes persulcatus]